MSWMNITEEIVGSGNSIYPERSRINKISPNRETFKNRAELEGGSSRFSHLSYSPEWDNVYKTRFQTPIESKQLQMRLLGTPPSVFDEDAPPPYPESTASIYGGKGNFYDGDQLVLLGGGLFDLVLDKYPKESQKTLEQYGDSPIVKLTVYRTPLKEFNNYLVNIISLGSYDKIRKELGKDYDKMYHLALVALVQQPDGTLKNVIIEKHARVNITTKYETNAKTEMMPVALKNPHLTVKILTETLRRRVGDKYYFAYSALGGNNCQNYVLDLLKGVNLLTPELHKFIFQDLTPILKNIAPHTRTASDLITNFWAWKDKLLGRGANPLGSTLHTVAYQDIRGGLSEIEGGVIDKEFLDMLNSIGAVGDKGIRRMKGGMREMEGSGIFDKILYDAAKGIGNFALKKGKEGFNAVMSLPPELVKERTDKLKQRIAENEQHEINKKKIYGERKKMFGFGGSFIDDANDKIKYMSHQKKGKLRVMQGGGIMDNIKSVQKALEVMKHMTPEQLKQKGAQLSRKR